MTKSLNNDNEAAVEMERFAYTVSHDLSAPARHIRQFTDLLRQRIDDKLEPKDKELADIIEESAMQMEQMISALLAYSRICTNKKDLRILDLNMVVHAVLARFSKRVEWYGAVVNVSKLPEVEADWNQIFYVFEQLIDNALSLRQKTPPAVIDISGGVVGNMIEVQVRDNGIGISPEQSERVFQFFYQNDPKSSIGLGVGLPMSRKTIETHGGRMWIDPSSLGTIVKFVLPTLKN